MTADTDQKSPFTKMVGRLSAIARAFGAWATTVEKHTSPDSPDAMAAHQIEWARLHIETAIQLLTGTEGAEAADHDCQPADTQSVEPADDEGTHSLRGYTKSVHISELLGFIASMRKSGTLLVNGRNENYLLDLHAGKVAYAQGDNPPEEFLLGQILVAQGALKADQLSGSLDPRQSNRIGAVLLEQGLITRESLKIALSYQIQHLFHRLCNEEDAYYQFEEGVHRVNSEEVRLNINRLLLETARRSDEEMAPQSQ